MTTIPVASRTPVIGSLLPMLKDPVTHLVEGYRKHGSVFRLNVMNRTFVVMAGVEANQFLSRKEREYLQSGPIFGGFATELGGELFLAGADGDVHKRLRRIQTPSYGAHHLEKRVPEVVTLMRDRLSGLNVGEVIDVQRLFQLLLAEQVGLLVHNESDLGGMLDDLIRVFRSALLVKVMRQWPELALKWPAYMRSRDRIIAHARKVARAHAENPDEERRDLVDDILNAVRDGDTITEENVPLLTLGPLFGGIDTASNTSAFALYNVLARPEVRERVMAEVREIFADTECPDWDAFKDRPALRGLMMETLRMYPVAYLASRHVAQTFEFDGHTINQGEHLFVATAVPHFLDEFYPEPHTFDVDRYSSERREHAQPGAFAPFGTGVHSCLGARFAQSQIMVTLAVLLHTVDMELAPTDYKLKVRSNPVTMPDGLKVRVRDVRRSLSGARIPWPAFNVKAR